MLVLRRLKGECIYIGKDVVITVTRIKGKQVWLGVDAPPSVVIMRDDAKPKGSKDDATNGSQQGDD